MLKLSFDCLIRLGYTSVSINDIGVTYVAPYFSTHYIIPKAHMTSHDTRFTWHKTDPFSGFTIGGSCKLCGKVELHLHQHGSEQLVHMRDQS